MSQISTISEFLLQAGTDYRVFDMGRAIHKISSQQFLDIENGILPPPRPRAGHAWFGIVFWNKQLSTQHYIWFVKLPIDEQGKLVLASRNHFLQIIVDALGQQLENAETKNGQLPENPYSFVPAQQQLADFNSISRRTLMLGQSSHYQDALAYLSAPTEQAWQSVPLQGITDVAADYQNDETKSLLISQFDSLATEVKFPLLISLENQTVEIKLAEKIQAWLIAHQDPIVWQHGLRSLSQSPCKGLVAGLIDTCLKTPSLADNLPLLTVIGGRLWQYLESPETLKDFMQTVALHDNDEPVFAAVYADLVQVPSLRPHILGMLRWPEKPEALTKAIGKLFSGQGA